jgi:hypothetical protein
VLAYQPTYLGGDEAQAPVPAEEQESAKERAALVEGPSVGETGDAVALAVIEETARRAGIAADFTPAPGTLLSVATLTPAAGIPRLTLAPTAAVLTAALAEQTIEPEPRDRR